MSEALGIDFVSPLPPVRSGIADYSADLLAALAERVDLRLIELPGLPIDDALRRRHAVAPESALGAGGRLPLYQMGNNHYHEAVYDLARRSPGVLTLHDLVLHHFLIGRTANQGRFDAYRSALEAEHGWIGAAAAAPLRWPGGHGDAAKFALPAHRRLIGGQRGVLTHSRWAAGVLREELPGVRVRAMPMGVPLPPPFDAAAGRRFRRRHGVPEGVPLLGTFGFQTPMKRTRAVLRCLAAPALAGVHLLVGGEVAPAIDLEGLARELGIAERVHVLGFLPFDAFEAAIAAVDLCLNLRYPTAGETSASLLRILAVGKPAVISDYAQSAELAADGVVKVPVGEGEEAALVARLGSLLADRPRLEALGAAARRAVAAQHRPADAAAAVVEACRDWRRAPPLDPGPPAPPPATSLIDRELAGSLEVEGAAPPWPAGARRRLLVRLTNGSRARWLAGERFPGGIALEARLEAGGRDLLAGAPWPGLPFDLAPGASHTFSLVVRRPLGPARLHIEPHVLGRRGFARLGGPVWEAAI